MLDFAETYHLYGKHVNKVFFFLKKYRIVYGFRFISRFVKIPAAILDFGGHLGFFFLAKTFFLHYTPYTTYMPSFLLLSQFEQFTPFYQISKPTKTEIVSETMQ